MKRFQLVLLAMSVAVACADSWPTSHDDDDPDSLGGHPQLNWRKSRETVYRPRRWILSWLLSHGAAIEHVDSKQDTSNSVSDEELNKDGVNRSTRRGDYDDPSTEVPVHLSGDTLVNYPVDRSRVGALAHESDAEIFDWNLFQDDKDKKEKGGIPHYYQSNSVGGVASRYGDRQARPATGILSRTRVQGGAENRVNTFNRFPISYEQSQEYDNLRQRN